MVQDAVLSMKSKSVTSLDASTQEMVTETPTVSTFMTVTGQLKELCIHVSARTAAVYWPSPADIPPPEGTPMPDANTDDWMFDERPLIDIRAQGGSVRVAQSLGYLDVDVRLQRSVIEDRLIGPLNSNLRYLARSFTAEEDEGCKAFRTASSSGLPPGAPAGTVACCG